MEQDQEQTYLHCAAASEIWNRIDAGKGAERVRHRLRAARRRRRRRAVWISVPAAAVIAAAVILIPHGVTDPVGVRYESYMPGAIVVATDEGEVYRLDGESTAERVTLGRAVISRTDSAISVQGVADVAADPQMVSLSVPRGESHKILLEDGSTVWLNAESTLRFPTRFGDGDREVELTGEACFDVAHDAARPFRVKSGRLRWEVLGTVFNISAYPDSRSVVATLVEGSIRQTVEGSDEGYVIRPMEQVSFDRETETVERQTVRGQDVIAWRGGTLIYRDLPLAHIALSLGRAYGVEIEVSDRALAGEHFHIIVDRGEPLAAALDILKRIGGFAYEIDDRRVLIY